MAVHCWFFRSSTVFMVCQLFCLADDNVLLVLQLINGFQCLRTIFLNGWQQIACSSARQRLSRFACHFAQPMTVHCSYFHSSKGFTTVCTPYYSADGIGLLILPLVNGLLISHLVNGFPDGSRAVLLSGWQRIAHTSAGQSLSCFAHRIAQWMVADYSSLHSSTAFPMVLLPYCSADGN